MRKACKRARRTKAGFFSSPRAEPRGGTMHPERRRRWRRRAADMAAAMGGGDGGGRRTWRRLSVSCVRSRAGAGAGRRRSVGHDGGAGGGHVGGWRRTRRRRCQVDKMAAPVRPARRSRSRAAAGCRTRRRTWRRRWRRERRRRACGGHGGGSSALMAGRAHAVRHLWGGRMKAGGECWHHAQPGGG